MANNFFLNQDPLLFQNRQAGGDDDVRRQLSEALIQYQQAQQRAAQQSADHIAELDGIVCGISDDVKERLNQDPEYSKLNSELQAMINREVMWSIKGRLNSNQEAVRNMTRQKEIIREFKEKVESEQRRNLSELNDYVKNYPSITFEEYKRIKGEGEPAKKRINQTKKEETK